MKNIVALVVILIFSALVINYIFIPNNNHAALLIAEERLEGQKETPIPYIEIYRDLDSKYHKIRGSQDSTSFFIHYCLPGFVPRGLGDCKRGVIPGSDPLGVQVEYYYALKSNRQPYLEGGRGVFPFPINVDVEGKTPYVKYYKERDDYVINSFNKLVECGLDRKQSFEGLVCYVYEKEPNIEHWWVPENISEYKTKLGNPPIFVCGATYCVLTLDQGNGWLLRARFNETALENWRQFFVDLNRSVGELAKEME